MDTCIICKAEIAFPYEHFCRECLISLSISDMKDRTCVNCEDHIPQFFVVSAFLCWYCRHECMTVQEGRDILLNATAEELRTAENRLVLR